MIRMSYKNVIKSFNPAESVLFVGSGISYHSGLPMGDGLRNLYLAPLSKIYPSLKSFVDLLKRQKAIPRLEIVLQKLVKIAGIELLSALALLNEATPNRNHIILAKLLRDKNLTLVLTSNFDNLIEQAGKFLRTYHIDNSLTMAQMRGGILKLHGDAEDTNTIVATVERIGKEIVNEKKTDLLREVFGMKYVYVYGYSGMDEDIVEPIRDFKWKGVFWFDMEGNLRPEVKQMLETHPNGHFVPLSDYTLLEDISKKTGLRILKPEKGKWSQNEMRKSVHECLTSLDEKEAQYIVGSLLYQIDLNAKARRVLEKAVISNPRDTSEMIGLISLELGKIKQVMGHFKEAIHHCQQAQKCQLGEHEMADAACTEAYMYVMGTQKSEKQLSKALDVLDKASKCIPDDHPAQARIMFTRGDAYFESDKIGEALEFYKRAEKIYKKEGMLEALLECHNSIGMAYLEQGKLKQAEEYYEKLRRYSQRLNNRYFESCALINIGELQWYFGENENARTNVEKGIKLENQYFPNSIDNATTCEIYAKILLDLGDIRKAEEEIARGLALIGDAHPSQKVCLYAVQVRICGLKQKRWVEGFDYIKKGLRLLESNIESKYDVQWFYLYSAEFYLRRNYLDEAQEMLKRAAKMMGERGSYIKALYFYLSSLLSKKRSNFEDMAEHCRCCRDVINACGINTSWLSQLPALGNNRCLSKSRIKRMK